jgi:hypothetical protein
MSKRAPGGQGRGNNVPSVYTHTRAFKHPRLQRVVDAPAVAAELREIYAR